MAAVPLQRSHQQQQRPQLRVVAHRRNQARAKLLQRLVVFGFLGFSSFLASSLAGNVLLEEARNDGKAALRRSVAAREYKAALQRKVLSATGVNSVEAWAKANGFLPPTRGSQPSSENSRVALAR